MKSSSGDDLITANESGSNLITLDGSSDSVTTLGSKECTCGGCGTGTACAHNTRGYGLDGVSAYAAPDVHSPYYPGNPYLPDDTTPNVLREILRNDLVDMITKQVDKLEQGAKQPQKTDSELISVMRDMLQSFHLINYTLAKQIDRLEQDLRRLRDDNLELKAALDAINDIAEDNARGSKPLTIMDVIFGQR
jgi:hypothetical protein